MKTLFLMYGTPASGKSSFIRKHHLEEYTTNVDHFREIFGHATLHLSEKEEIFEMTDMSEDDFIWDMVYTNVEHRMQHDLTTIIDATFLFKKAFKKPFELAKKYGYKVVIIDMMADLVKEFNATSKNFDTLLATLIVRDTNRYNSVGQNVIEKYLTRYFDSRRGSKQYKFVTPSEFVTNYLSPIEPLDFNHFNRIKIIGDVHGDYSNVLNVFEDHQKGDAYIFVGDYLDRGSENAKTFQFLNKLKGSNLFFLRGNHEKSLQNFVIGDKLTSQQFKLVTLPELMRAGVTKEDIATFISQLQEYVYFTFDDQTYFVSHAGIEPVRLDAFEQPQSTDDLINFANVREFTHGIVGHDGSPYSVDIDKKIEARNASTIQIHGHRNAFHHPVDKFENTFNLTAPNTDDSFRYMIIEH